MQEKEIKMKIAMLCFTRRGRNLEKDLAEKLRISGHEVLESVKCQQLEESMAMSAKDWTAGMFRTQDVLIFIGALQIAVRLSAPFLKSKVTDPAVLVMDEKGQYCIPVLSGHIGGANEMAVEIGKQTGALPVITTATDINQRWAVDVFAKKNHLYIEDMTLAKKISADILEGKKIRMAVEGGVEAVIGEIPEEVELVPESDEKMDIYVGIHKPEYRLMEGGNSILQLVPRAASAGIGCKKGTELTQIEASVREVLQREQIHPASIGRIASIDLKKEEEGLLAFCRKQQIEPEFYTAEELRKVPGTFSPSAFVQGVTGVDNVCERSAVCAGGGCLHVKKQAKNGVTVALAWKPWRVRFE